MTYNEIKEAVRFIRGDVSYLSVPGGISDAIREREAEVWQYADWPQKQSAQLQVSVTGGSAPLPLPAGVGFPTQTLQLFDDQGYQLDYLDPADFWQSFGEVQIAPRAPAAPTCWTIVNDLSATPQIRLGPTPPADATFLLAGWALPIHRSDATTYAPGTMSQEGDLPWWPDAYHGFLVDGAVSTLKRRFGDPSYPPDEGAFQAGLARLAHELNPAERRALDIWGEDC